MVGKLLVNGVFWSAFENFSKKIVSFVLNIFIARMLCPEDYGIVAILAVFLSLSHIFIEGGFGSALIQKHNFDQKDVSTIFFFNAFMTIVMYIMLLIASPFIADFYNNEILATVLPVMGLGLIIQSFGAMQSTKLTIDVNFKSLSMISLPGTFISAFIGLALAYYGFGVWALVFQSLSQTIIGTFLLICIVRWRPSLYFSFARLKSLFTYGVNILISNIMYTLYTQSYIFIIGKKFSGVDLGYYTRASQLYLFPSSNIINILKRVYFPILCKLKENREKLLDTYEKMMQASCLIIFPMMMCLSALSFPLIDFLLGEKWIGCAWILQILCFRALPFPLTNLNLDILNALGYSKIFLKITLIVRIISLSILIGVSFYANILMIVLTQLFIVHFSLFVNSYYVSKYAGYSTKQLISSISGIYISSVLVGVLTYLFINLFDISSIFQLIIGGVFYFALFSAIVFFFNVSNIKYLYSFLLKMIKERNSAKNA